ncbi:MAG: endonuclease/exonuclease/phosphatase family protein [Prevotella sp.]|nr:endonuclease/exonuclease/phosphatase family protein [Prevotella sp.]
MIKQLKKITTQMIAGANIATVIVMCLVGFSDQLNPIDHPVLSCVGMTFPLFLLANMLFLFFWLIFKFRMIWIPVLGYLLAFIPISIYMPLHLKSSTPPEGAIKLISYNVCEYGGNYKYEQGFEKIRDYLFEENPDIVCLQEDVDTWRRYCFQHYEKKFAYNDTVHFIHSDLSINGVGIHTRFPIIRKERIPYKSTSNGSVAWYLQVGKDTLLVINNHFEGTHLSKEDRQVYQEIIKGDMRGDTARMESKKLLVILAESSSKRAPQVDAVCRYVEEHRQYPTILCGDFNDTPISYSRYRIAKVLTDCFVETGTGLGLSYNQKGFYFRIDHIFHSKDVEAYNCKIDSKIDASDHYPIVCWLKIGGKD